MNRKDKRQGKSALPTPTSARPTLSSSTETPDSSSSANEQESLPVEQQLYKQVYRRLTVLGTVCYVSTVLTIFLMLNDKVPTPYMDESFHVDQVQAYCAGNFSYVSCIASP
jgi:hypothetical protein